MADIEEILKGAKLPERTVPLCLRGDLQAEFEDLERQLAATQSGDEDTLASTASVRERELADRIEALRGEMEADTSVFRFRGLSARAYSDLLAQHKPTEQEQRDGADVNWKTFPVALIAACAVDPVMTLEQAERLNDKVTNRQWDDLFAAAYACNRQSVDVPFSLSASAIRAASAPSLPRRERGASRGADSSAGSLAG